MNDLADEKFVSLTTFRRNGSPVPTTVWIARDGDAWVVTTPADSGKVKRLRNDPRVEMRPSSRLGRIEENATTVGGTATVIADPVAYKRMETSVRRKYGLQYHVVMAIEKLFNRKGRDRVMLRIAPERQGFSRQP